MFQKVITFEPNIIQVCKMCQNEDCCMLLSAMYKTHQLSIVPNLQSPSHMAVTHKSIRLSHVHVRPNTMQSFKPLYTWHYPFLTIPLSDIHKSRYIRAAGGNGRHCIIIQPPWSPYQLKTIITQAIAVASRWPRKVKSIWGHNQRLVRRPCPEAGVIMHFCRQMERLDGYQWTVQGPDV